MMKVLLILLSVSDLLGFHWVGTLQCLYAVNNAELLFKRSTTSVSIFLKKKTALKIVRERVVSAEAQPRTNQAQITVLLQKKN